jgi:hypothetical protein
MTRMETNAALAQSLSEVNQVVTNAFGAVAVLATTLREMDERITALETLTGMHRQPKPPTDTTG